MALEKCPECGHDVSSLADFCPHCGFPLSDYREEKRIQKEEKTEQVLEEKQEVKVVKPINKSWVAGWYKKQKRAKVTLGIFALIFVLVMTLFFCLMPLEKPIVEHGIERPKTTFVIALIIMPLALSLTVMFLVYLFVGTIIVKEFDGYTVLGYRGAMSNTLVIENEVADQNFWRFSLQGTLPNGKSVIMPYFHPLERELDIYLSSNEDNKKN